MMTIQRFFWGHMLVAVAALSVGYAAAGMFGGSLVLVFAGAFWFTTQQRGAAGLEGLLLYAFFFSAGLGLFLGASQWLMMLAGVATLGAWDLDHFLQRLNQAERVEYGSGLGREHLRRLGIIEGIGLLAGLLALNFHPRLPFWWEALIALLVFIGVSRLVAFVRSQSDE